MLDVSENKTASDSIKVKNKHNVGVTALLPNFERIVSDVGEP